MKHFIQGYNECYPTVLGIYLEKDPKQIIGEILGTKAEETTWNEYTGIGARSKDLLAIQDKVREFNKKYIPWFPGESFLIDRKQFKERYSKGFPYWPTTLPPTKGFITLTFLTQDLLFGMVPPRHIIAFDGQKVYDPNLPYPISYSLYQSVISSRSVPDTLYCPEGVIEL